MVIKKYIKGGLNSDVSPSLVPDGDYLNALNIRGQIGDDGKAGVLRPVPGHTKISNIANDWVSSLDTSTQDVKHICVDDVNGYAYAFVSGGVLRPSPNDNIPPKILRIDLKTGAFITVITGGNISDNWEPDNDTTYLWDDLVEAKVVGDTLIWLNKYGQQFSLNVKSYINSEFLDQDVDRRDISLIKAPPAFNLEVFKIEDASYSGPNYIKDNVFQFAYRYIYVGFEQSVVSSWSREIPYNTNTDDFNAITLSIPLAEKIPVSILYIDLLCKNNTTGAINLIKRFSTEDQNSRNLIIDHNSGTQFSTVLNYVFYNDNIYEAIDQAYFLKQFDTVPIYSKSLEISKDRLFLSNNVEGYDAPEFEDITVTTSLGSIIGARDIDYSLQTYEDVNVYDNLDQLTDEYYYWRNIMFIDGISQPGWYFVLGDIGGPLGSSYTSNDWLIDTTTVPGFPNVVELSQSAITNLFTVMPNIVQGCEIYVSGFSNPDNNGFYVVEGKSLQSITAVKSDNTSLNVPANEGPSTVTIRLLSSFYGKVPGDIANLPTPTNESYLDLLYIGSQPFNIFSAQYFINRDFSVYNNAEYATYASGTVVPYTPTRDVTVSDLPTSQTRTFKSDSRYNIGIQFYDFAMRKCGVVSKTRDNNLNIIDMNVAVPDRSFNTAQLYAVNWGLPTGSSNIPLWAKYYSIVRTDNLNTRYFIQGNATGNMVKYVTKNTTTNEYNITTGVVNYNNTIAGVSIDLESILNDGFGYIYEASNNDVVKIYRLSGSTTIVQTLKVIGQQGRYIILEPKDINGGVSLPIGTSNSWRFEIRRPYKQTGSEFFFEGTIYAISNWGTAQRAYSIASGSLSGDTFLESDLEYMNLRKEFRNSWFRNLGRSCFIDPIGQVYKPSGISWSNVFIPGSKVNGLSTFDALDYKDLPVELGPVNKLKTTSKAQSEGNVMLAIGQNYTASLYIGETSLVDNAGQTLLTTSGSIVGTVNVLKGKFGTTIPSSVVEYDGNVYWADILNECVVRYSGNGLFAISDYGMRNFFRSYFKETKALVDEFDITQSPYAYGGYNPATDEYILSFTPVSSSQEQYPDSSAIRHSEIKNMYRSGTQAKSVGFSLSQERWSSFYSHGGPYIYFGGKMYSFVKSVYPTGAPETYIPIVSGGLFEFDKDSTINSFSGSVKDSFISIPYNDGANNIKIFQAACIEGDTAPTTTYVETFIPNNQVTNMVSSDFVNREDMLYSEIFRDRVSPNATGTADEKMYTGDKMRGQYANMSLVWATPSNFVIRFVNANVKDSIGHNKLSR
jgi:hypothetical protein